MIEDSYELEKNDITQLRIEELNIAYRVSMLSSNFPRCNPVKYMVAYRN